MGSKDRAGPGGEETGDLESKGLYGQGLTAPRVTEGKTLGVQASSC